jgi:hypothetical protein
MAIVQSYRRFLVQVNRWACLMLEVWMSIILKDPYLWSLILLFLCRCCQSLELVFPNLWGISLRSSKDWTSSQRNGLKRIRTCLVSHMPQRRVSPRLSCCPIPSLISAPNIFPIDCSFTFVTPSIRSSLCRPYDPGRKDNNWGSVVSDLLDKRLGNLSTLFLWHKAPVHGDSTAEIFCHMLLFRYSSHYSCLITFRHIYSWVLNHTNLLTSCEYYRTMCNHLQRTFARLFTFMTCLCSRR